MVKVEYFVKYNGQGWVFLLDILQTRNVYFCTWKFHALVVGSSSVDKRKQQITTYDYVNEILKFWEKSWKSTITSWHSSRSNEKKKKRKI